MPALANQPHMAYMTDPRYILAAVYTGCDFVEATHLIFEVTQFDLELAECAARHAAEFDSGFQDLLGGATLTTPNVGGEHVLTAIPEELKEWLAERPDSELEDAILLPREIEPVVERVLARWREEDDLRWASRAARLQCSADSVHIEVEDKYTADTFLWTRDVAPIFAALRADFETPEFSTHVQG